MYTERVNSISKSAIIEHHRSVGWSETEYQKLLQLLLGVHSIVHKEMIDGFDQRKPLFLDYCKEIPTSFDGLYK